MEDAILIDRAGAVTSVILNRPRNHNALTPEMLVELRDIFNRLGSDDSVRVIVLRGRGRSFCAGADLGSMRAAA